MNRAVRRSLTAGAVALVSACSSDSGSRLIGPGQTPLMEIRDGHNGGNSRFFFLPPIRPRSLPPPKNAPFNPNLSPVVDICELTDGTCTRQISHLTTSTGNFFDRVFVSRHFEEYAVFWRTDQLNLDPLKLYRISVVVGTQELGIADVDVVRTFREAIQVDREEFVPLFEDFILPIRFRIEEGALCDAGTCNSTSIDLAQGGFVVLQATGERVDIPAQLSGPNADLTTTITVQLCDGIDIDLPLFGNCLRATADPPLRAALAPRATVSMCSLQLDLLPLSHPQAHLVSLHRQDDDIITVLPHSTDFCSTIGRVAPPPEAAPQSLTGAGWRLLRRGLTAMFGIRSLHASAAVLNVGPAGDTDGFSDFQFALPAQMLPLPGTDEIFGLLGQAASPVPGVVLLDGQTPPQPVAGARVKFQITGGDGSFGGTSREVQVTTDAQGIAAVPVWILGIGVGENVTTASGRGFAGPLDNGPFVPDITLPYRCEGELPCQTNIQLPVPTDDRTVVFPATTLAPDLIVLAPVFVAIPSTVAAGGTVTLSPWINFNQGDGDATSDVSNGFYLSTDPVITPSDVRLDGNLNTAGVLTASNGFAWGAPTLTIPAGTAPGTYYVGILVDETDALLEWDETNNYASTPVIVIAAPPLPGLPGLGLR